MTTDKTPSLGSLNRSPAEKFAGSESDTKQHQINQARKKGKTLGARHASHGDSSGGEHKKRQALKD
jgi:hypothetical protein